jgi:hypothetical protein
MSQTGLKFCFHLKLRRHEQVERYVFYVNGARHAVVKQAGTHG